MYTKVTTAVNNVIVLPHTRLTLRNDGIVEVVCGDEVLYKRTHIEEMNLGLERLLGEKKACLLVIAGKHTSLTKEGREYSASAEATKFSLAEAYVIRNVAQRIIGNFYIRMDKPPVPTKLFTDISSAEKWLERYKA